MKILLLFFLTKLLSVLPQQQQQRAVGEWVWKAIKCLQTEMHGPNSHKHILNETPQILPQLEGAVFSNTAVSVWAKFFEAAVRPTGGSTINSSPSISRSLTNVTLFSAARAQSSSPGASHCHFTGLRLPARTNSKLCFSKDHTAVYFYTIIPKCIGPFSDWQTYFSRCVPGFQRRQWSWAQCDKQQAETWDLPENFFPLQQVWCEKEEKYI